MGRVYLIYDRKDNELYAWSESKNLAKMFIATRKHGRFYLKEKKLKLNIEADKLIYAKFCNNNRDKCICISYLGQEHQDTNYIEFPVTQYEDFKIEEYCNNLYDNLFDISRKLCMLPLSKKLRNSLEFLSLYASKNENISFDTFKIFIELFGDTVL